MDPIVLRYLSLLSLTEIAALWCLKKYAKQQQDVIFLGLGVGAYALCGFWLSRTLIIGEKLGVANSMWNSLSNIYGTIIGGFMGDILSNNQILGVGAATVSSVLLSK